jgi:hypothetical protein
VTVCTKVELKIVLKICFVIVIRVHEVNDHIADTSISVCQSVGQSVSAVTASTGGQNQFEQSSLSLLLNLEDDLLPLH